MINGVVIFQIKKYERCISLTRFFLYICISISVAYLCVDELKINLKIYMYMFVCIRVSEYFCVFLGVVESKKWKRTHLTGSDLLFELEILSLDTYKTVIMMIGDIVEKSFIKNIQDVSITILKKLYT